MLDQAKRALTKKLLISYQADADLAANALSAYPAQRTDKHEDWSNRVARAST